MSNETNAGTASGRTFKAVGSPNSPKGELKIVRFSQLAEAGTTGIVAEGILEAKLPNKFNENQLDYRIRNTDTNDLVIVNGSGQLSAKMSQVSEGSYVRITYLGKQTITKGKLKGKSVHNVEVEIGE